MTQLALALDHRPAMGEADFLVASSNRDAVLWLDRWPDWPGAGLAIHGPAGCGKSHLAQVWRRRSGARSITAATIANEDPASLLSDCIGFAIEDADRGVDERALLHLYNWTAEQGGNLLLTGRSPPARWGIALPDLRSRLAAMPAVAVTPPDDALFAAVLIKHFADRQSAVLNWIAIELVDAPKIGSLPPPRTVLRTERRIWLRGPRTIVVPQCRERRSTADCQSRCFPPSTDVNR